MDTFDIENAVDGIERVALDWEAAHGREDELYRNVLQAIANGDHFEEASALAAAALKTQQIEFQRVCA